MAKGGRKGFSIIPVFIPNQGCPHRCVFCHQEKITNQVQGPMNGRGVKAFIEQALGARGLQGKRVRQVAFYGGTFTSLNMERMRDFLGSVQPFLKAGLVESIRVSTRPDSLDQRRLEIMREHGVTTVELGAQSMDDEVLELTKRGHRAADTVRSVRMLRDHGFSVGIQLMPGLPGDSRERFRRTVEKVVELKPDMVRLYPVLVIKGTELAKWYQQGKYRPLELEEAVVVCRDSCVALEEEGIPVIRIGLLTPRSLFEEGQILAGPWHDSFGFLVRAGIHLKRVMGLLPSPGEAKGIRIRVPAREIPLLRGYKNQGVKEIERITGAKVSAILPDESLSRGQIRVDKV
ncbi:MAG: radical SAM protein [Deltaproteobacteria bacterium]|nr:radical SAM protein [Deltaproteobacteria bacterium]